MCGRSLNDSGFQGYEVNRTPAVFRPFGSFPHRRLKYLRGIELTFWLIKESLERNSLSCGLLSMQGTFSPVATHVAAKECLREFSLDRGLDLAKRGEDAKRLGADQTCCVYDLWDSRGEEDSCEVLSPRLSPRSPRHGWAAPPWERTIAAA
jgi:hypothetical protein